MNCPKCGSECEGEAPKKPWFLHCECECGFEFCYDSYRDEYYDINGDKLGD
jgi:hypothetical protein